jgi:cytosine deaminase
VTHPLAENSPDDLVLASCAIVGSEAGELVDISIGDGRITGIKPAGALPLRSARRIELDGRVVSPTFIEPHLHLDKALLGGPAEGSTLAGAIAYTSERKREFTAESIRARAEHVLADALRSGTTAIRAQTEVDPGVGLLSIGVMSELARTHADWLDLQIAVFPQEGLLARPGTLPLMREALRSQGTIVGGCPYSEANVIDARAHIDTVLELAAEFDTLADLHLDLADDVDDERFTLAEYVAQATVARGLQGRVALGHVTTLAAMDHSRRGRTLDALAAADIGVVVLPATDLYLIGRTDASNTRRGVAPIEDLWHHGVRAAASSNNIRNAFTPTGRADPLDIALLLARVSFISSKDGFARILETVTSEPAALMHLTGRGRIEVGAAADIVVLDTRDPRSVVIDQPLRWLVLRQGNEVFTSRTTETGPSWMSLRGSHER